MVTVPVSGVPRLLPTVPAVVVFSFNLEGMDGWGGRSKWICRGLTLCIVDPVDNFLLLLNVGLPCLRREVVLCHGRGERNKEAKDPLGIYILKSKKEADLIFYLRLNYYRHSAYTTLSHHRLLSANTIHDGQPWLASVQTR